MPSAPIDCMAEKTALFCATVPNAPEATTDPGTTVDQLRPCGQPASVVSFCLTLPTSGPSADRGDLIARRQDLCSQLEGREAPDFCLVAPGAGASTAGLQRDVALALLRQRLGAEFRRASGDGVQLWTEVGVASPIVEGALALVTADAAAVQAYFGRAYAQPPAIFLFLSHQSFSFALQRHFGVEPAVAAQLSQQLLGVLLTGSDAVAINGESIVSGRRPVVYRHELAHVLIHQLAGDGLPAWLDEGLATRVSAIEGVTMDPARIGAVALLRTDRRALSIFTDRRDWQTINTAFGGRAYGVAAEAVIALERRTGRTGITDMLEALGRGDAFDDAFARITGESFDDFIALLPAVVREMRPARPLFVAAHAVFPASAGAP